ncbi:TPA: hypothetical protein ACH3X1_006402 [Trebouxia sp. C0004]
MDTSASSVLDEPKQTGDGSDTQIQSKLGAAAVAATAEVPAVGAAASGESAPLAAAIVSRQRSDAARVLRTAHPARVVGAVRKQNPVRNVMQRQRLAARKAVELAAQRAAAADSDTEGPGTNPSGFAAEWSKEDMAAPMGKIAELEAAARKKDATLGNISAMSLEVPSSSGEVEEPAAVYAARLAQLAARRAKKGAKTVSSAPLADESAEPRHPKPFTGEDEQDQAGAVRRFCNTLSLLFELSNMHPDDWALHGKTYLDGTAADYMHTAMHALPATERTWARFCALLGTRFGQATLTLSSGIN